METYTGRQRVAAAFKKTFTDKEIQIDRIAAYPIMGQCNAQLVGATIKEMSGEGMTQHMRMDSLAYAIGIFCQYFLYRY